MADDEEEKLIREQIADVMEHRSVNANGTMIFTLTPDQRDVIVKALRDVDFLEGQLDAALYAADDR